MTDTDPGSITFDELRLAARNHAMPLEALQYDVTPVGLHYLLIHYDIPVIDAASWRLRVDGSVDETLELSLDDLRAMTPTTSTVTLECAGNGRALLSPRPASQPWVLEAVGTATWTGVPLADVLALARPTRSAIDIVFTGADRGVDGGIEQAYQRALPADLATAPDALLAYEVNGSPLPPQHGFPLRLVVPGWYGMASVKWLRRVTVTDEPFDGYYQTTSYNVRQHDDDAGEPVTRIVPRSLMVPPGIPDFFTRSRIVTAGRQDLEGRAWSGHGAITRVDVSTDGGRSWEQAEVDPPTLGPSAWQAWRYRWTARPGDYVLCCRAADAAGNEQPVGPTWNTGGYLNNAVQRVDVHVTEA